MTANRVKEHVTFGALAGLIGGLVFGAAMFELGALPTVASIVRADTLLAGTLVHMAIAVVAGVGFGVLVLHQRSGPGETLLWGVAYGTLWWLIGPLTLMPMLLGNGIAWTVAAAQEAFPSLVGHMWFGASAALAMAVLRRRNSGHSRPAAAGRGDLGRGAMAGLIGLGFVLVLAGRPDVLPLAWPAVGPLAPWPVIVLASALAGVLYAALFVRPPAGIGAGLVRGAVYGYLLWALVVLTLAPLLAGRGLTWSLGDARTMFPALVACVLFGAALVTAYQIMRALVSILFVDEERATAAEAPGIVGMRAVGRGAVAGLVGGLLFTFVMVQVGFLAAVAELIGSTSTVTGLVVHAIVALLVGALYGLLYRGHSQDAGSALGWGVSYGFVWWLLGPLTLMPLLLGAGPQWTVDAAAAAFPSLVGHLAYGAGLGLTMYWLEARHNPWWISRSHAEASRVARRRELLSTAAPALWVLVVVVTLMLPILIGR